MNRLIEYVSLILLSGILITLMLYIGELLLAKYYLDSNSGPHNLDMFYALGMYLPLIAYGRFKRIKTLPNIILSLLMLLVQFFIVSYLITLVTGLGLTSSDGHRTILGSLNYYILILVGQSINFLLWQPLLNWKKIYDTPTTGKTSWR